MRAELGVAERVHEAFEDQVTRTPDRPALVAGTRRLTYRELDAAANAVAHALIARGLVRGDLVGVRLRRGPSLVPVLLGVLKAGCAYVPLDPAAPRAAIADVVDDARLTLIVVDEPGAGEPAPVLAVADIDHTRTGSPAVAGAGDDLAYVIYTSGSTGRPKGVEVEHRNVLTLLRWAAATYSDDELRGVLGAASVCFDASVAELFPPLVTGGSVVLADNLLALPGLAARDEVTFIQGVPSVLAVLARTPLPPSVRTVAIAGEPLSRALVDRLHRNEGVRRIINCYGPTEATVNCSSYEVGRDEPADPPIGTPLPGAEFSVRDEHGRPLGDGETGELWVSGALVTRGYLRRPELTAAKFVVDGGVRHYRTGDLVRRQDGRYHFAGRADDQVKVRGFRVEPGQVQAVLLTHPSVGNAVVIAPADEDGERRLVAFAEPAGERPTEAGLREWLRERLPAHLIPSRIAVLDAIPLGTTGKADRAALAAWVFDRDGSAEFVAPRTDTERLVAEVVATAFGLAEIGVHDRFADSGGHSLAAARAVARLRDTARREIGLEDFLTDGTVAAVAQRLDTAAAVEPVAGPVADPRRTVFPLTHTQRDLWTLAQLSPAGTATTTAWRLRLHGPFSRESLQAAADALVARHHALRATVHEHAGEPLLVIGPPAPVPLDVHDLRGGGNPEELAAAAARYGFDLSAETPLLRLTALRLEDEITDLVVVSDHFATDGASIAEIMAGLAGGEVVEPRAQIGDVALREQAPRDGLARYWAAELAGAVPPDALFDRPAPAAQRFHGERITVALPPSLPAEVEALAAASGVTAFAVHLSALGVLTGALTNASDVLLGTAAARRDSADLEHTVGPLVDVLPVRLRLDAAGSFRDLLRAAMTTTVRAIDHRGLPPGELTALWGGDRPAGMPLTPVSLSVQPAGLAETVHGPGVRLDLVGELPTGGSHNPLTVFVNGGDLIAEHDPALLSPARARWFLRSLRHVLGAVVSTPDVPLSTVDLLTDGERAELTGWGTGAALPPSDVDSVPAAVLHHAARTPDAPAVSTVSYRELTARADRVARGLVAAGVLPGDTVGVHVPRDELLPAMLLAVWRAGAGYLPLDPSLPVARLTQLVTDADVKFILARGGGISLPGTVIDADAVPDTAEAELFVPGGDDLAYVLYTSGSTGRPKGVEVTHANLHAFVRSRQASHGMAPDDTMAAIAPLAFDVSVEELWWPLSAGARCVVAERDTAVDGHLLAQWLAANGVTVADLTPTSLRMLLAAGWPGDPSLRLLLGGEVLDPDLAARALPLVRELWNGYGPTETTVAATAHRVTAAATVPLGGPTPGTVLSVRDAVGRLVPSGAIGELWIGGAGVARGYRGRPELTGFVTEDGDRWYRTGDLVRWRPDGTLDFLGRADGQVKVRGNRFELGEVEAALRSLSDVDDAAVTVVADGVDAHLAGYLTPATADAPAAERALRRLLPGYMVPSRWLTLDALPLLPNGKLDRRRLPEAVAAPAVTTPLSPDEAAVAAVWRTCLEVTEVGPESDFFALGGRSLAATRVVGLLRERAARRITVRTLFDHPVLADFTAQLGGLRTEPAGPVEELVAAVWAQVLGHDRVGALDDFTTLGGDPATAAQVAASLTSALGFPIPPEHVLEHPVLREFATALHDLAPKDGPA